MVGPLLLPQLAGADRLLEAVALEVEHEEEGLTFHPAEMGLIESLALGQGALGVDPLLDGTDGLVVREVGQLTEPQVQLQQEPVIAKACLLGRGLEPGVGLVYVLEVQFVVQRCEEALEEFPQLREIVY